jgi:membrane-bound serine protease (ClpP class)
LLLVVGAVALYVELHVPGIGLGGLVAAVCFALFFWSRFLGGTAGWLAIVLFVAGVCFLLVEVFVLPGFAIFGLGGGALVLLSVVLASQTFLIPQNSYQRLQFQNTLLMLGAATGGTLGAILLVNRYLPKTPLLGQVVLEPPNEEEAASIRQREALVDYSSLLGTRGTTTTQLVPSGKALIANRLVDVMTDGEFIARGVRIEVVEAHGNRVLVREVE